RNRPQVSSGSGGWRPAGYRSQLGAALGCLPPAGSVTGAPTPRTLEVIREAEGSQRGYFTGVFGYHDGERLDSGVMIRYIERGDNAWVYRSGGGITKQSGAEAEYREASGKGNGPFD